MEEKAKTIDVKKTEVKDTASAERTKDKKTYIPRVDIYETKESLVILADMPGVDENNVKITLERDVLTIEGTVDEIRPAGHELGHAEYGIGDFYRAFTLSEHIDRDRIEAKIKNGVLNIALPKGEQLKTKKIPIHAG